MRLLATPFRRPQMTSLVTAILALALHPDPLAASRDQSACPAPEVRAERRVKNLLSLPRFPEATARFGLGTVSAAEMRPLTSEKDLATCRALWSAVQSQPRPLSAGDQVSFYRSGDTFFVPITPRRPAKPGTVRIGEYSMIEVYDREYRFVARFGA